ncbi:hypothetical protein FRC08_013572 [Ceratobasidium sp. 394]|nr:hypothetical protein FRC08_013572 [Ceratobasidium sp. 394]
MSNRRTSLTPINALPLEILSRILALSKQYCNHLPLEDHSYDITTVCTRWRQLAINTPSLWTHIDVGPVTPITSTRLLLERTKDTLVHIHVYEPQPALGLDPEDVELETCKVIALLKPHIRRVRSLDLESYAYSASFVSPILNMWLDRGSANPPGSLFVHRPYCNSLLSVDEENEPGTRVSQSKNSKKMLRSLGTLHLRGAIFPWDSGAYHDLTDFRLHGWDFDILLPVSQFVGILSTSPALVILKLAYITITRTDGWNQATPTTLSCLKVLDLVRLKADSLALLLPLIAFPRPSNDLSAGLSVDEEIRNILEVFFARACMQTLYCRYAGGAPLPDASLLRSLPLVDVVLILDYFHFSDAQATQADPVTSQASPLPRIPNVILMRCSVTFEGLRSFVAERQVQNLRLEVCSILGSTTKDSKSDVEAIRNLLLEVYPTLECAISERFSTNSLPVREWDDHWYGD